ncbi:DUF1801 domain-containing protein [Sediminicola luteus]|uniref:YdhG-like domain-containing protein n=1 Tax=Sediminicola luteus TaxID=319238 RepID=A0A2A4G1M2_9FLAO|nr:DUF1801 domain-containing protein [Sediminicola luteus]PCE62879.1 hypothetical protein B7P33_16510 [Sediminicola luteus]
MSEKLLEFYLNKPEPLRGTLLALRDFILKQDEHLNHQLKYGMPFFCYGKKMCCYLWTDKKTGEPYVGFVEGKRLDHPALEQGQRARMKIFRISTEADLPLPELKAVLDAMLAWYRKG